LAAVVIGALSLLFALAMLGVVLVKCNCNPVNTAEKAFQISKQFILENKMDQLRALGGDASIFEASEIKQISLACSMPPRFHFARWGRPYHAQVLWYTFVNGDCAGCWDQIVTSTIIDECGQVGSFSATLEKNVCAPLYWPPGRR
jgi:hypothetical protein